jgi:hypothetical protein
MIHLVAPVVLAGNTMSDEKRHRIIEAQQSNIFLAAIMSFLTTNTFPPTLPKMLKTIGRTHMEYQVHNGLLHRRFSDYRGTVVWKIIIPPTFLPKLHGYMH